MKKRSDKKRQQKHDLEGEREEKPHPESGRRQDTGSDKGRKQESNLERGTQLKSDLEKRKQQETDSDKSGKKKSALEIGAQLKSYLARRKQQKTDSENGTQLETGLEKGTQMKLQDSNGSSNLCKITNQSGQDVVVITPTTSDPTSASDATKVYNQNLEILALKEGGNVTNNGKSGTVTLDQTYTDPKTNKPTQSLLYNLLISNSTWYYPVANLSVMQDFTTETYPDQIVTNADAKSLQDAASFIQTTQAYPTSKLTKDYQAALSSTQSTAQTAADGSSGSAQNVSNSITESVNNFFESTDSYKDVTLAAVTAMQSYYDKFPFAWAKYSKTAVTYYLYGNDGSTTTFQGTLVLTPPSTIDLTKANGGYTIKFNPAKKPSDTTTVDVDASKAVSLTYADGLFTDSTGSDISQIAVKGMFMLKRTFTQVETDTSILPVITGSVYGLTVTGFDSPQLSDDKNSDFWSALFHPKTSAQVFSSVMEIGGAIMMLQFFASSLFGMFKWAKGKISTAKDVDESATKSEFDDNMKETEDTLNESISDNIKEMSDGKIKEPGSPEEALDTIDEQTTSINDNQNAANIQEGLDNQEDTLETLGEYESSMTEEQIEGLESTAKKLKETTNELNDAIEGQTDLGNVVDTAKQSMDDISTQTTDLATNLSDQITEEQQQAIKENQTATEQVSEEVDKMNEAQEETTTNDNPEGEDPIEPEGL
ncbi:hypothetical protein BTJ40_06775 [Microbulbifer sp. A4B17]|uniref:hypothetical protein n=1 Tax=Microbulbifer sp. A4B17 TaxID=359370 RepID=UPI000D52D1F0|nr:hypothetical protein [Microbulbifer sp. A4B17]AWF80536.1 hypothetical protein BTJ40_06775 [Microbulbifer sp. A4B17]